MSLSHILLTLTKDPVSGYDLNQVIEQTISHFWSADQAQVYRHLKQLQQKRLLTCIEVAPDKGPARKVYQRTRAGHTELVRWLKSDPVISPERATHVAQLVFLWEADDLNTTLEFIKKLRIRFESTLEILREIESKESNVPMGKMPLNDLHGFLGLKLATETNAAKVAWCDWAIRVLRRRIQKEDEQ